MPITFKKIDFDDIPLTLFQDNVDATLKSILLCQLLNGQIINNISFLANQDTYISHGLGRNYVGFIPILPTGYGQLKVSSTVNNSKNRNLILQSETDQVSTLYIF